MNEDHRFMLLFTLGPVQTFITQARKTRDLWISSLLLSKSMEAAMQDLTDNNRVFPTWHILEETPDIPNKYIALFKTAEEARTAAANSQQRIKEYWRNVCNSVWYAVIAKYHTDETLKIWKRQTGVDPYASQRVDLNALFEIYWVIVDRTEKDTYQEYGAWLEATEGRLAARKRLRDFHPREEPGEKSAISGEREILRGDSAHPASILQFWKDIANHPSRSPKDLDQEGKERLDSIDTVKRFAMGVGAIATRDMNGKERVFQKPFPSTSSLATASFVEGLLRAAQEPSTELKNALETWRKTTDGKLRSNALDTARDIPYLARLAYDSSLEWLLLGDGDLYFSETFVPRRLKENYSVAPVPDGEKLSREGASALKALLRATAEKVTRPIPYYSVIQMDGDNMGILLSGVPNQSEHEKISDTLSSFARKTVPDLVEKRYPARLVYAGGDDVLAIAPLARDRTTSNEPQHVFDLVDQLQQRYQAEVREALSHSDNEQDNNRLNGVTASTGLVIAHHYTPLSYVLRSAREAESIAKKEYGRNALVVTLIRRSGEQTRVGCHWRYNNIEADGQPLALFSRFYQLLKHDVLSPKCVYILLEEAPALVKAGIKTEQDPASVPSAMQSEIKRVLKRQRDPQKEQDFPDQEVEKYASYLTQLAAAMDANEYPHKRRDRILSTELHAEGRRYGLIEVLGWLLVIAFLTRKEQE